VAPHQPPAAEFVRAFVATSPFDEGNPTVADVVHGGAIGTYRYA